MKILHSIHSPKIGGIERLVIELAIEQKRQGLDVTLLLDQMEGQFYSHLIENKIKLLASGIKGGFTFSLKKRSALREIFSQYDLVHFHSFSPLKLSAASGFKTVYTIHGLSKGVRKENVLKYYFRETLKSYFLNKVNYFVANSDYTSALAQEHYGLEKVSKEVILNGVRIPEPFEGPISNGNEFTIGLVSRFTKRKRIERLIEGFDIFLKKGGLGKLILVGDGETFGEIKELVRRLNLEEKVELAGYSLDVQNFYQSFDICVFPSEQEPFGLVAVESYLKGKPVLAFSDSGGLKEVISPLEPENIVSDVEALAEKLLFFYRNRNSIVENAALRRDYAKRHFSIQRMERDYLQVYKKVLEID